MFFGFTQQYGDKEFYLLDSLNLDYLSEHDRVLLDSSLENYHNAKTDTGRITAISNFVEYTSSDYWGSAYNDFIFDYVLPIKDDPNRSREELKVLYQILETCYSNKGYYLQGQGKISESFDNHYKALEISEGLKDKRRIGTVYLNLGSVYHHMGNYQKALEASKKAEENLVDLEGSEDLEIYVYNNLAVLSADVGNFDESLEYHDKSLKLCEEVGHIFGVGMARNNLGGLYHQMDSFDLAMENFYSAEQIFKDLDDTLWLSLTYHKMGKVFFDHKNYNKAISYANQSYDFAVASGQIMPKIRASYLLYRIHNKEENFEEALYFYRQHEYWNDSISSAETKMDALQKELTFKNEREKAITEKENEKKWEVALAEKQRKSVLTYSILGGLILVIIFLIILYFRLRIITKQKKLIEKQNEERKLLLQEIHHRVKNNFQIVSSVLKLQAAEENNSIIDHAFDDAINRIHSMAAVHEMIYKQEDFGAIAPKDYFTKLTDSMRVYSADKNIRFDVDSQVEGLNISTLIPLGISVNEMITNSLKYAFIGIAEDPRIRIRLEKHAGDYVLSYQDNGVGIGEATHSNSFGMELIRTIIEQIDGRLETVQDKNWNTHLRISFK